MFDNEIKGMVLRFEKSSIYDGDGLRTVLFLKGCPLRCLWCSTPESQSEKPERGIVRNKCTLCGACVKACPNNALSIENGKIVHLKSKCDGCLKCSDVCLNGAIAPYGKLMSTSKVLHELAKDEMFYFNSGGGVTISGGEPFAQPEFLLEIVKGCREHLIKCALETSFYAKWETIEPVLRNISLLHVDIKCFDSKRHKELTNVSNELILENILKADALDSKFDIIIRTPLIPGINDNDEYLLNMADFVKKLKKLRFMEFLAYHKLGTETYNKLEIPYALPEVQRPCSEYMLKKARMFKDASGVCVKINGEEI